MRRRFVQDGEVAVEYAERRAAPADTSHVDGLRAELAQERQARVDTENALKDAQSSLRSCQTRLGHVELALQEARAQSIALADAAMIPAPAPDEAAPPRRRRVSEEDVLVDGEGGPARSRRAAAEPQPVKWWIK